MKIYFEEGMDFSSILNIQKYEPAEAACLGGNTKGNFPSFLHKTDETRVQVLQGVLTKYKGTKCYVSSKKDGSSCSIFFNSHLDPEDMFGVCSRNQELKRDTIEVGEYSFSPKNTFWAMAEKYDLEYRLKLLNRNLGIQGEVIGEGIQGNKYGIKGHDLRVFQIFDIDQYKYLDFEEFIQLSHDLGLQTVPILDTNFTLIDDIDALVEMAKGNSVLNPKVKREGIVIRPLIEIDDPRFGRISLKSINPEFLLKYDE
jgi:RNA ligase (TIGR02306 family)